VSKEIIVRVGVVLIFLGLTLEQADAHRRRRIEPRALSGPTHLWTKRMKGAISGLSLSRSGKQILVTTHPDGDIPGSAKHSLLSLLSTQGRLIWEQPARFPIKDFAISARAELIVLATYDDQLIGVDSRGRRIWTATGSCKPFVIEETKRVLCYHDDDSESQVAFDVLNWEGQKVGSFPIQGDIVAFKLSEDQKMLVIGLTGGEIVAFGPDLQPLWRKKLDGEVIDLGVSNLISAVSENPTPLVSPLPKISSDRFKVAALVRVDRRAQKIEFFSESGQSLGDLTPSFSAEQLEISKSGDLAFYYGNNASGQWIGGAHVQDSAELWRQGEPLYSRYSGSINLSLGLVWTGVERTVEEPVRRESRVVVFDEMGKKVWDLGLPKDDTSYIFSHRITMVPNWFVVGTDDARLSVYKF